MRDSFCGWWRNRLTTQKNDRRWRTKEHPDHLTVDRSYTICNNRPGHCPSQPWVLCLPLVGLKLKKYCKSLLCFLMTVWFTQNFIECPKTEPDLVRPKRSLKEGVSPTHTTHYCWLSHSTRYRGCFLAFLSTKMNRLLANKSCFFMKFFI